MVWKAYQTYSDGTLAAWDDSNEDSPAARVKVTAKSPLETVQKSLEAVRQKQNESFRPDANTWLAGVALVIGLASFLIALRKR